MYQTVDEDTFLSQVLRESSRFSEFFIDVRDELPPGLHYAITDELRANLRGTVAKDSSGQPIVIMPTLPTRTDDHTLAHELMHLVLEHRGFPAVSSKGPTNPATAFLNSALLDPLVEQSLGEARFNVVKKFKADAFNLVRETQTVVVPDPPFTLGFVLAPLKYRLLWPRIQPGKTDIHFWVPFSRQNPGLAELVAEIAGCLDVDGYDTPSTMTSAMELLRSLLQFEELTTPPATT